MKPLDSQAVRSALNYAYALIRKPGKGALRHDYLVPAGPYTEQWDWDAFFMGVALTSEDKANGYLLKNWACNCIENAQPDGKVPGCITPAGADPRLHHMKPFLAQGALIACQALGQTDWVKPLWDRLQQVVLYRERELWSNDYDLAVWFNSMESGADNNVAAMDYPDKSVVASDANAYVYREYLALSKLAALLADSALSDRYAKRAAEIKANCIKHLWSEEDQIFYNLDSTTGKLIKVASFSSFIPIWAGMADQERGKNSCKSYLLNSEEMWTEYGIRSLSKRDSRYNNVNMIKPYSNWQGPVWPIANYLYMHALLNYGLKAEASKLAQIISRLVLDDIKKSGGMHENYDAETGEPLAAPNFVSWNILVPNMIDESEKNFNPLKI